jgi:hypothetical protein
MKNSFLPPLNTSCRIYYISVCFIAKSQIGSSQPQEGEISTVGGKYYLLCPSSPSPALPMDNHGEMSAHWGLCRVPGRASPASPTLQIAHASSPPSHTHLWALPPNPKGCPWIYSLPNASPPLCFCLWWGCFWGRLVSWFFRIPQFEILFLCVSNSKLWWKLCISS